MAARRDRLAGFTLIEALIGIVVLSVMFSLLMSALFAMTKSARGGEHRIQHADSARLVMDFLRRHLEQATPLTERVERESYALFFGEREAMRFVGHLPAHRGGGGLQYLHLTVEAAAAGHVLVLYHRSARVETPLSSSTLPDEWQRTVLLEGVDRIRFSYFGGDDDETRPGWSDAWPGAQDSLPALVKVELEYADGRSWPPLVVAVRTQTAVGQPHLVRVRRDEAS
jgi:general secretion pathway protein J